MNRYAKRIELYKLAVVAGLLAAFSPSAAFGHSDLATYIHHREAISVGRTNIDVEVELTFYQMRSLIERRCMDADHDGVITRAETKDYLAKMAGALKTGLRMTISGRAMNLVPLYDPEIDLLGVDQIAPQNHILRLFYFVRTPTWLAPGSVIRLEDNLWADVPSIGAGEVNGGDGIRVVSDEDADAKVTALAQPRIVLARVVAVPLVPRPQGRGCDEPRLGASEALGAPLPPSAGGPQERSLAMPSGVFREAGQTRDQGPVSRHFSTLTILAWPPNQALLIGGIGIIIVVIVYGVAVRLRPQKQENNHATNKTI